ncbi:MAG TPA: SDR family NAD(P)-dependent oxidoreductase [Steroidobacteraceae bacterium]|jgi:NAD(P)-dependent dehydrogenase (short-subunit alcohol dehydrogenase family)
MNPADARAIISGGASGLGLAAAKAIIEAGGQAVLLDVHQAQAAAAVAELGARASCVCADVTRESEVEAAVAQARERMGAVNVAVNCAGIGSAARLVGRQGPMSAEFFRRVIEVNLVGTLLVCRSAAVAMQRNEPGPDGERGVIVMTASVSAFEGQIGQIAYSASKGGIVSMTLPMARELASSGIRVISIAPGVFLTPMLASMSSEVQASLGQQVPFPPRLGQPQEYAALVLQILENRMFNGTTIRLDGAMRMQAR